MQGLDFTPIALPVPDMKRVVENGYIELSNNICEQMIRHIKMNLKTAGNIDSEGSAKHNAFMYSVIESCRMAEMKVDRYLHSQFDDLKKVAIGEDLTPILPCIALNKTKIVCPATKPLKIRD